MGPSSRSKAWERRANVSDLARSSGAIGAENLQDCLKAQQRDCSENKEHAAEPRTMKDGVRRRSVTGRLSRAEKRGVQLHGVESGAAAVATVSGHLVLQADEWHLQRGRKQAQFGLAIATASWLCKTTAQLVAFVTLMHCLLIIEILRSSVDPRDATVVLGRGTATMFSVTYQETASSQPGVSHLAECAYPALWYLKDDWPGSATPVMRPEFDSSHTTTSPEQKTVMGRS
ncbi:hypothetical protein VTN00DRAFT_8693 [Thermoascus crustaceus]|uniref:uncharacterized protein n=1 Tax=Thermoascus crustaceus TaxID=5088 RepID=UPI003743E030